MDDADKQVIQLLFQKMADVCAGEVKLERWTKSAARVSVSFRHGPQRAYLRPERLAGVLLIRVGGRALPQDTDTLVSPSARAILNVLVGPY